MTRLADAAHRIIPSSTDGSTSGLIDEGGQRCLVTTFTAPPRIIVFGSTEQAAATAEIGSFLGYRVTVCDARAVFATAERFPAADQVVNDWPHRYLAGQVAAGQVDARTVILVLTHDPKFDIPVLELAVNLPVAYIGAMGSRRTHDDRLRRLREAGVGEDQLRRLSSPVGLDLGSRTPAETAVSIAAEIILLQRRGTGARLAETSGPIHSMDDLGASTAPRSAVSVVTTHLLRSPHESTKGTPVHY